VWPLINNINFDYAQLYYWSTLAASAAQDGACDE
jgi:hypothetical protein